MQGMASRISESSAITCHNQMSPHCQDKYATQKSVLSTPPPPPPHTHKNTHIYTCICVYIYVLPCPQIILAGSQLHRENMEHGLNNSLNTGGNLSQHKGFCLLKLVSHIKLLLISEIGIGKILSWTGEKQGKHRV